MPGWQSSLRNLLHSNHNYTSMQNSIKNFCSTITHRCTATWRLSKCVQLPFVFAIWCEKFCFPCLGPENISVQSFHDYRLKVIDSDAISLGSHESGTKRSDDTSLGRQFWLKFNLIYDIDQRPRQRPRRFLCLAQVVGSKFNFRIGLIKYWNNM